MLSDGGESHVENFAKVSELNILLGSELGVAGLFPGMSIRDSRCVLEMVVCYMWKARVCTKMC